MSTEYVDVTFAVTGERLTDDEQESLADAFEAWCTVVGREPVTMATNPRDLAERDRQVAEQAAAQALDMDAPEKAALAAGWDRAADRADAYLNLIHDMRAHVVPVAALLADGQIDVQIEVDALNRMLALSWERVEQIRSGGDVARADSAAPARPTTDDREAAHDARVVRVVADLGFLGKGERRALRNAADALASRPTAPTPTVSEVCDLIDWLADARDQYANAGGPYADAIHQETALARTIARALRDPSEAWGWLPTWMAPEYEARHAALGVTATTDGGEG